MMTSTSHAKPEAQSIVIGGGCFWCVEALFETLDGVESAVSGYAGGTADNPTYQDVISGQTGHAEVIKVTYHPDKINLETLLAFFWDAHDPTTLNRQGADVGTQYRSIILYETENEKALAELSRDTAQQSFSAPIVTEIAPLKKFYPAEKYHQDYYRNNPTAGYCRYVIAPKLKKLGK